MKILLVCAGGMSTSILMKKWKNIGMIKDKTLLSKQ